jgi:SAM-dependent methyltransferase
MDAKLQRRVQRYGWDRAASDYEPLWEEQLAAARAPLLGGAALARGQAVLDVACGTGLVSFEAARAVGRSGRVLGTDISGEMVRAARPRAAAIGWRRAFWRMDAAQLAVPAGSFDAALCGSAMYVTDPRRRCGSCAGRYAAGTRRRRRVGITGRCGWAAVFPIVQAEVASEVCPLFLAWGPRRARRVVSRGRSWGAHRAAPQHAPGYADATQACGGRLCWRSGGPRVDTL